ncbi:MAG TPA: serine protease [Planctomycetaceae bacterium]|nr:serine protease [Planctomycetaceae bacterium]
MLRRALLTAVVLSIFLLDAARADEGLPPQVLQNVKAATVFVRLKVGSIPVSSGSGFVIRQEGENTLIATNHHVIQMPDYFGTAPIPAEITGELRTRILELRKLVSGKTPETYVVFGSGSAQEQSLQAEILGEDPIHDLAILKVRGAAAKIQPIDFEHPSALQETLPVYAFGFPFGLSMALNDKGPSVTITKATVSSIRQDERGEDVLVQIDGSLNPGNSGGPIVDSKGGLVAISVLAIQGAGIGFGIPGAQLARTMDGGIVSVEFGVKRVGDDRAAVKVRMRLSDPMNKVRSTSLNYSLGVPTTPIDQKKPPTPLANAKIVALKREGAVATGEFEVPVAKGGSVQILAQPAYVNSAGKTVLLAAQPFVDDFADFDRKAFVFVSVDGKIKGRFLWTTGGWLEDYENRSNPKKILRGQGILHPEVDRNDEYVTLRKPNGSLIRLYPDRISFEQKAGGWETSHHGAWKKPTEAETKLAAAPAARPGAARPTGPAQRSRPAAGAPKVASGSAKSAPAAVAAKPTPAKPGAANPPAKGIANAAGDRVSWSFKQGNKEGTFAKAGDGWTEENGLKVGNRVVNPERHPFREVGRTDDYVELIDNRKIGIRLYADHADFRKGNGGWTRLYSGQWDRAAVAQADAGVAGGNSAEGADESESMDTPGADERTVWKYENQKNASGTFRRAADGWVEEKETKIGRISRKETIKYREKTETDDYVEMIDERRNITNRIYADHTEWRFGNGPWIKEFQGSWVTEK